jgi:pimeloyl-ACP methyl ester carboxylesterase
MPVHESWTSNGDVKIHVLQSNPHEQSKPPLLICPGLSEPAENYIPFMSALEDRRCITFSFRGRGKSDAPKTGYSLEDHVQDIEAVVTHFHLQNFYLMGYSRGVSYALGYAIRHPQFLKGLILAEYTAEHKKMPGGWAEAYLTADWGGTLGSDLMNPHVVMGIERESKQVEFRDDLQNIHCPVLIIRGTREESLLSAEQAQVYVDCMKNVRVKVFEKADHALKDEDFEKFVSTIQNFLFE